QLRRFSLLSSGALRTEWGGGRGERSGRGSDGLWQGCVRTRRRATQGEKRYQQERKNVGQAVGEAASQDTLCLPDRPGEEDADGEQQETEGHKDDAVLRQPPAAAGHWPRASVRFTSCRASRRYRVGCSRSPRSPLGRRGLDSYPGGGRCWCQGGRGARRAGRRVGEGQRTRLLSALLR